MDVNHNGGRMSKWERRIARGIGTLAGAYWAFILLIQAIWGDTTVSSEGMILAGLIIIMVIGVVIAWHWEGLGGIIVVIGSIALGTFAYITAGHNKLFAVSVTGLPFLVAGILFLTSYWKKEKSRIP
ncbi:MAG: hypothetical protein J7K51_09585 [Thermotogae bacterium]|nr:hypothetical protein [Thermotogota bacterium]